ncbi:MAG: hypothetical protein KDK55_06260 [Chlamydiia bacterium]|nr:hypothetical protein [Chlamydiia bacterium]
MSILILFVVLAIGGTLTPIVVLKWKSESNEKLVMALFQEWEGADHLPTPFLAQMLDLKVDLPLKMGEFDCQKGEETLALYPIFKKVSLKKRWPEGLLISYKLREPLACVGNFENIVIDREGVLFPLEPFYFQKKLPTLFFDPNLFEIEGGTILGKKIPQREMDLAIDLMNRLPGDIDLSRIDGSSYGGREIVVQTQDFFILRLTRKNYPQELANYFSLRHQESVFHERDKVIVDLRISGVAYIGHYEEVPIRTNLLDCSKS